MNRQKRVAAIHDISCFGKCSLTVALPIISAAGIETSVIPTAVLSTHTGGFSGYTFRDLTDDILPVAEHWKGLGLNFDAVYTGYLGSFKQLELVSEIIGLLKAPETHIIVDPVMADNGRLYSSFPENFPEGMKKLCALADVVVPNITEASLLLGLPYVEGPYTREYIEGLLRGLLGLGSKAAVLTGVSFEEGLLGAACIDVSGSISYAFTERIEGSYHGTGDVFASALTAALLKSLRLEKAIKIAAEFTVAAIKRTRAAGTDIRYGVNFEAGLRDLAGMIEAEL